MSCSCCQIVADLRQGHDLFPIGDHWTLNANVDSERPSLVLQSRDHVPDLGELDPAAQRELAEVLPAVSSRLRAQTGAQRVYVMLLNEGAVPHVHWHIVPRYDSDEPGEPVGLIGAAPPRDRESDDPRTIAARVAAGLGPRTEPSILVRSLLRLLKGVQRFSAYRLVGRMPGLGGLPASARAEVYVPAWLALLGVLLASTYVGRWVGWLAALLALYRLTDMLSMQFVLLIDRSSRRLSSYPRSFVLALLNLVELVLITAIWSRAVSDLPVRTGLLFGFDVVTLRGGSGYPGWELDLVGVLGAASAIVVLTGVVSVVVGRLADSYIETRL